jgi:KaiC/GvpD/RAD55 family RecA-like ATPase
MKLTKIPTGIESLDPILEGGLPSGSTVLLLGEIGAGDYEFILTSCARMLMFPQSADSSVIIPDKVIYISFTRSKDDVLKEMAFSFPGLYEVIEDNLKKKRFEFKDFSSAFFADSFIPESWTSLSQAGLSFDSLKWSKEKKNLINRLIEYLDNNASGNIIIFDSLTALAQYCLSSIEWKDLIVFLRGLQRVSKNWDGIVYAILSQGIFDKGKQEECAECMDGVIVFDWEKLGPSQRKRVMYLKKFRGLLPLLDLNDIVNFEIQIDTGKGFEISNIKRVRGR